MTRFLSDKSNTRCDVAASEEDATDEVLKHAVDVLSGDKSRIWNPAELYQECCTHLEIIVTRADRR